MSTELKVSEALAFLETPKERKELEQKFSLSNTQSFNLLRWLKNAKLINETKQAVHGRGGLVWTYQKARRR